MVTINLAYTAPINPAGASPILCQDQIWAGLKRKVRRAQDFVPVIVACEVLSEEGNTVVRQATFRSEDNTKETNNPVKEVCVHMPPSRVDFQQEDGSTISNIVSKGTEGDLFMTYSFEWRHPKIEEGSQEQTDMRAKYEKASDTIAPKTIAGADWNYRWRRWLSMGRSTPYANSCKMGRSEKGGR